MCDRGACVTGGRAWPGGVCGGGYAWQGGMCGGGGGSVHVMHAAPQADTTATAYGQ